MNTSVPYLLGILSLVGAVNWIYRPGVTSITDFDAYFFNKNGHHKGLMYVFSVYLSVLYQFVIEPIIVFYGLTRSMGNQQFAYFSMGVLVVLWIRFFSRPSKQARTGTIQGPMITTLAGLFFYVPLFYLCYLFLVSVGLYQ